MKTTPTLLLALVLLLSIAGCETKTKNIDICKCLTEPGNSDYITTNRDACRDAISKEIGVENWEKVNMSQNKEVSDKFDALAKRCQ